MTNWKIDLPKLAVTTVIVSLLLLLGACGDAGDGAQAPASPPSDPGGVRSEGGEGDGFLLPEQAYPPAVRGALETALEAYDDARALLAGDSVIGLDARARRLADALAAAGEATVDDTTAAFLDEARRAALGLAGAATLPDARAAFGEVSRFLMAVVAADPVLTEGRFVFACPMEEGFNKWIQSDEEKANPYMGPEMLACGETGDWTVRGIAGPGEAAAHAEHVHGEEVADGDVAFWTCPMHPSVKSAEPGQCPICGMDLTPVTEQEVASGVIFVDERRRQLIGVKTEPVGRRPLASSIRAVGRVTYDESRLAEVSVKYEGWIGELHVDKPGQAVRRGQPLFTLYSPALYAAQQELLTALASQRSARDTSAPHRADYLVEAARERLRLWDLTPSQIDRLAETGEAVQHIPIHSPVSGFVVDKKVVEGASVQPGMMLFRIAGLDQVWVEAELYEAELSLIEEGQPATVTLPYLPGEELQGVVAFVYPFLDGASRTGRVRVELANPELKLKPDMFANVVIERSLGERLAVPEDAVLYAGPRSYVFLDLGEGRLRPQRVETGVVADGWVEVLSGLAPGDVIVTSGNFLIAAESRLKVALEQWR